MQTMSEPDPICIHCDLMEHDLCVGSVFCSCWCVAGQDHVLPHPRGPY